MLFRSVVHGDREVAPLFADLLKDKGLSAHAPQYTEEVDLLTGMQVARGYLPERKKVAYTPTQKSSAYTRLLQVCDTLVSLVHRSGGRDNKTLADFAESLRKIIEKFEF